MNELLRRLLFLPPQASSLARDVDYLHYSIILSTLAGSVVVAAFAVVFAVRYRRRPMPAEQPDLAEQQAPGLPLGFEFGAVFGLLALFVGWWVIGFRQYVKLETPPLDTLNIQVIGKQWMWSFAYPNGGASNAVLYVPVARPVKLVLASRDVIHSFYVPAFRIKQDAVPGQSTSVWFQADRPGTYPVYCAEYCGTNHSTMRAEVVVLAGEDFARRLQRLPPLNLPGPTSDEPGELPRPQPEPVSLARMGEGVAARHGCLRCHTLDGTPHIGPTWAGLYQSQVPLEGGASVTADEAFLTESMMEPRLKIHRGFPAVMPTYQGLLDAAEVGALVELMRTLREAQPELPSAPLAPADAPSAVSLPRQAGGAGSQPTGAGAP
jgi:cytochrome c oxidase subunit 2